MTDLAKLIVKLEAQTAQYQAELKKSSDRLAAYQRQTNARLRAMQKGWAGFGAGVKHALGLLSIGLAVRAIVKATSDAEFALAQLDAAVKSTGGAAGFTVPQLVAMSEAFQRQTIFADEAVQSMQAVLLGFRRIHGPEFEAAQQAIVDIATRLGTDLQSAAVLVGKALNDPIKGMAALAKKGIQFTESQKGVIEQLARTGQLAQAQGIILDELSVQFGGAAVAARQTFGGALAGLKNAFGDLLEAKGGLPNAIKSLNEFTEILQDPATKTAVDGLFTALLWFLGRVIKDVSTLVSTIGPALGIAGTEVDILERKIGLLEEARDSAFPFVLTLGKSDFNPDELFGVLTPTEIDARIKALREQEDALLGLGIAGAEAAKKLKMLDSAGLAGGTGPIGDPAAVEKIEDMIAAVELQINTLDKGAQAVLRYRFASGDLAEVFDDAGPGAAALRDELLALTGQYERMTEAAKQAKEAVAAQEAIRQMVADLEDEIATLGLSEAAVLAYRLEHGKLAEQFAVAGVSMEEYKQRLVDLTAQLEKEKAAVEAVKDAEAAHKEELAEGAAVFEATRTAAERYAAEIIRLKQLLADQVITEETYSRAAMQAVERFEKAGKEINKFAEEATRNVQDILGTFLADLAESGKVSFSSLLADFQSMLIRMAAEAVAADIAGALFGKSGVGGGGGLLGSLVGAFAGGGGGAGLFAGLFGGGAKTASTAVAGSTGLANFGGGMAQGGDVRKGKSYRVGESGRAEWFFPGMNGKIVPEAAMAGGGMTVTQSFQISAPEGRVSRATQMQVAAAAQRGLADASRRNN